MAPTDISAISLASTEPADDGFALDVRIVESGPDNAQLFANTDDGCDTQKQGDC